MSKAFRCDRCKTCFSPNDMDGLSDMPDPFFTTITEYYDQSKADFMAHTVFGRHDDVHLCPVCARLFYLFMDGSQQKQVR